MSNVHIYQLTPRYPSMRGVTRYLQTLLASSWRNLLRRLKGQVKDKIKLYFKSVKYRSQWKFNISTIFQWSNINFRAWFYCKSCHETVRDENQIKKCKCKNCKYRYLYVFVSFCFFTLKYRFPFTIFVSICSLNNSLASGTKL